MHNKRIEEQDPKETTSKYEGAHMDLYPKVGIFSVFYIQSW